MMNKAISTLSSTADLLAMIPQCTDNHDRLVLAKRLIEIKADTLTLQQVFQQWNGVDHGASKPLRDELHIRHEIEQAHKRLNDLLDEGNKRLEQTQFAISFATDFDEKIEQAKLDVLTENELTPIKTLQAAMQTRLAQQVELQQALMQLQNMLHEWTEEPTTFLEEDDRQQFFDQWIVRKEAMQLQAQTYLDHKEFASLPLKLTREFQQSLKLVEACEAFTQGIMDEALAAHTWLDQAQVQLTQSPDQLESLRSQWQQRTRCQRIKIAQTLDERAKQMGLIIDETDEEQSSLQAVAEVNAEANDPSLVLKAISHLEESLKGGQLRQAQTWEKRLEAYAQNQSLPRSLQARITRAREAYQELISWQRWRQDQLRETLIDQAKQWLGTQENVMVLAKAITDLRQQWRELEKINPAPKGLWEKFHHACITAYAPAAEYFAQKDQERLEALKRREAFIAELEKQVQQPATDLNFKQLAKDLQNQRKTWQSLGEVSAKDYKVLFEKYKTLTKQLEAPLQAARAENTQARQILIEQAKTLDSTASIEAIKDLQRQWGDLAKRVSLEFTKEQKLWEQFKLAIDQVFKAKEVAKQTRLLEQKNQIQQASHQLDQLEAAIRQSDAEKIKQAETALQAVSLPHHIHSKDLIHRQRDLKKAAQQVLHKAHQASFAQEVDTLLMTWSGTNQDGATKVRKAWLQAMTQRQSQTVDPAVFSADLIDFEIALGLPSPDEEQMLRKKRQIVILQRKLNDPHSLNRATLQDQIKLLLSHPWPGDAYRHRIREVLIRLA